jgi:hypothetical protein
MRRHGSTGHILDGLHSMSGSRAAGLAEAKILADYGQRRNHERPRSAPRSRTTEEFESACVPTDAAQRSRRVRTREEELVTVA